MSVRGSMMPVFGYSVSQQIGQNHQASSWSGKHCQTPGGQATEPKDFNAATDAKIKKLKSVSWILPELHTSIHNMSASLNRNSFVNVAVSWRQEIYDQKKSWANLIAAEKNLWYFASSAISFVTSHAQREAGRLRSSKSSMPMAMVNSLQQNSEMCWKLWPKARGVRNAGGRCKGIERQLPQLSSTLPHCPQQREALVELRTCNEFETAWLALHHLGIIHAQTDEMPR